MKMSALSTMQHKIYLKIGMMAMSPKTRWTLMMFGMTQMEFSHVGKEFQHIIEEELHKKASYIYYSLLKICLFTFLIGIIVLIHEPVKIASICRIKDSSDKWSASSHVCESEGGGVL